MKSFNINIVVCLLTHASGAVQYHTDSTKCIMVWGMMVLGCLYCFTEACQSVIQGHTGIYYLLTVRLTKVRQYVVFITSEAEESATVFVVGRITLDF